MLNKQLRLDKQRLKDYQILTGICYEYFPHIETINVILSINTEHYLTTDNSPSYHINPPPKRKEIKTAHCLNQD